MIEYLSYNLITYLFYAILTLTVFRLLIKVLLSGVYNLTKKRREAKVYPKVSIIIPAYNEEKTIRGCLQSILNQDYPRYEVVVVDDGSTDNTLKEAEKLESLGVKVIHQENRGKANALNNGIKNSNGEIIITVDADTRLQRETLKKLCSRFMIDFNLGAVAGNIKVNPAPGILNALQAMEYTTGINLTRKAESMLKCVMIVPGPIAALRREAIEKAGLFSDDTFAEDFDITMKTLEEGYKVEFEDEAIAYTDAPKNLEDLLKQRRRWYRGMLQVLDKHRGVYLRPRYGLLGVLGVPNFWFEAFSPIINIALILLAFFMILLVGRPMVSLFGLLWYFCVTLIVGAFAISLDPKPTMREYLALPLLLFYNVFLDGVRMMALVEEIVSIAMRWEKPRR